jgi:hypothetical protein
MDKATILSEIKRIADANGKAPGRTVFEKETGVKMHVWYPHLWLRWSDALGEAGLQPNTLQKAFEKTALFEAYAKFAIELGRLPVDGELKRRARANVDFPSSQTFQQRFGNRLELIRQLTEHCKANAVFREILPWCETYLSRKPAKSEHIQRQTLGFVYLIKSGPHYKIGFSNAAGRREYELAIQLPTEIKTLHVIKTDDPSGVEAYWHKRFESKRIRGEWFALDRYDVAAFKRTKNVG